jgi:hypothetical protein
MSRNGYGHNHEKGKFETNPEAAALAALALGESLVYMMVEEGVLKKESVRDALEDAIDAQRQSGDAGGAASHEAACRLLERIMDALEVSEAYDPPGRR